MSFSYLTHVPEEQQANRRDGWKPSAGTTVSLLSQFRPIYRREANAAGLLNLRGSGSSWLAGAWHGMAWHG
jgi:hypothetical protein